MASWWTSYIARRSRQLGLDPRAVLAVARQEGLGGGVGDQGTSFGPFQLHAGGALPRGAGRAWAESPAGIDYALQQIARVARGQHGGQAISSIVSRFERPANPGAEIAGAQRAYGGGSFGGAQALPSASPFGAGGGGADSASLRAGVISALLSASQQTSQHRNPNYAPLFASLAALRQGAAGGAMSPLGAATPAAPKISGKPSLNFLEPFGQKFGLSITSTTSGNHVNGSYHYQGRAVDFGGSPAHMAALQRYAISHPGQFTEAFYTGPGSAPYYVKNGKVYPLAQLDSSVRANHHDHVHLAR